MAATSVVVVEAELTPVGGMRRSIAKAFTLPPLASAVQLLLLLGNLTSSRIAAIVRRACGAVQWLPLPGTKKEVLTCRAQGVVKKRSRMVVSFVADSNAAFKADPWLISLPISFLNW